MQDEKSNIQTLNVSYREENYQVKIDCVNCHELGIKFFCFEVKDPGNNINTPPFLIEYELGEKKWNQVGEELEKVSPEFVEAIVAQYLVQHECIFMNA